MGIAEDLVSDGAGQRLEEPLGSSLAYALLGLSGVPGRRSPEEGRHLFRRVPISVASVASVARTLCFSGILAGISAGITGASCISAGISLAAVASHIPFMRAGFATPGITGIRCGCFSQSYNRPRI